MLVKIESIFSNASSLLKPQQLPIFKLTRVYTPKPVAAPPRVSPSTTQDFHNISPTTQKIAHIFEPPNTKILQKQHLYFSITQIQVQPSP